MSYNIVELLTQTTMGHLFLISFLFWLTWGYCLRIKGWVSDDIEGMAKFSNQFVQQKDPQGNIIQENLIDTYDQEIGKDKEGKPIIKKYGHTQFNPHIGFPGSLFRWLRLVWGRKFAKLGDNKKGHPMYGWVQSPIKHHLLNLIFQQVNLVLAYFFLSHIIGSKLAWLSLMIFSVHPLGTQAVAWISGINYTVSLTFALALLNASLLLDNPYIYIPVSAFLAYFSCQFFLPGAFTWVILLMIGKWDIAIVAFLVGAYILLSYGKGVLSYRFNAFKEQHMEKSTKLNWRKVIVVIKTVWYYIKFFPFPKRLGLFHSFGYHFDEPLDHADRFFYFGFISTVSLIVGYFFVPPEIQFAFIWVSAYIVIFLNVVTAQQFVSERYAFIPSLGFCIILAYLLQNFIPLLMLIIGLYIMRVWVHLPSFRNEVRFYESNAVNFPDSEVALGNLGVAYLNHGLPGKAVDTWLEATRVNPVYDVPWYNLYSFSKQNRDLVGAKDFMKKCLDAKLIHFPEIWNKEYAELVDFISKSVSIQEMSKRINQVIKEANYDSSGIIQPRK